MFGGAFSRKPASPAAGKVASLSVKVGEQVAEGVTVARIEA